MSTLVLEGGTAIVGSRVVDSSRLVMEDGLIVEVEETRSPARGGVDTTGMVVMPGIIDLHSDGLEREAQPRPGVEFDNGLALGALEGRARSAGITTLFHGVAFEENRTWSRSLATAERSYSAIEERMGSGRTAVDHRVLHRLDARDRSALEALERRLPEEQPLVSFEDHTPGQGQFADVETLRRVMVKRGTPESEADEVIARHIADREAVHSQYEVSLSRLSELALRGKVRMLVHDPTHEEQVARFHEMGAAIAEFPCTVDAARAARAREMPIVVGAPNVVLGGSHSGNIAAERLVADGLADALASDYAPHALLAAVFGLVDKAATDLASAVGLVTSGPAAIAGLGDRGLLAPGRRADVVVVDPARPWPRVVASWRAGERRLGPLT